MTQAAQPDPLAYPSFNAFFTRALTPGARPLPADAHAIACPADGRISQFGSIRDGRIFQAKGRDFSAAELLGNEAAAAPYADGRFITVYLSPRDYHRVHAPLAGVLRETLHIPGRLFSVAPFAVDAVPRLFARNERLVCHFDGANGPFALVMVGAMLVSGVETVWSGVEIPPYVRAIARKDWRDKGIRLQRGAELGRFNMGSTVIVLLPSATAELDSELSVQMPVKMGQSIGRIHVQVSDQI
jgi:phosphatidylserine decarboxylase